MLVRFSYFFMVFEISSLSWPFILILLPPPQCRVVVGAESLSEKRNKGNDFILRCLDCVAFVLILGITTNVFN